MPSRPPKYRPGATKRPRDQRPSSSQRGYDARWRRARKRFLSAHPLCEDCREQGRSVIATDVDHKIAVSGPLDPLFWDVRNWRPCCHACHSRKTVAVDGGFGK
jgi:5-methylcytosine-specific restriction enzyme A